MSRWADLYKSTLGKKLIVAITGVLMLGFLLGHVAGNLKVFLPPVDGEADIDVYAHALKTLGEPFLPHGLFLWIFRAILLACLVLHVICIAQLALMNRFARPVAYVKRQYSQTSISARWMLITGVYLLLFIVFHILHFTVGTIDPGNFEHGKVYANLHAAFAGVPWAAVYVFSMLVLALHLYHGIWSLFQTIGLDNPGRNGVLRRLAIVLSVGLFLGFAAVPGAFVTRVLDDPQTHIEARRDLEPPTHFFSEEP